MAETGLKLDGLRKYRVAVSGLVVLALIMVASGEQITHKNSLNNNGTTHIIESNYLFELFNLLGKRSEFHYHHVWPELEFGWSVIVGSVIGFLGAAFGSVGGVGGGGIFVPMLTLIIGFDPKTSTAISKCMITGAAGATVYYSLKLRHPLLDLPIIDYDLALLFQPMLLLGISIGVVLNVLFAEWMVTILLIILFLVASIKAFFKGFETWKKETIIKEEAVRRLTSNDAGGEEVAYKLIPGGPKNDSTFTNEVYKAKEVSIFDNMYWKDTAILIAVWIIILFLHVSKNYAPTCSTAYWILNLLQLPIAVGASAYEAVCLYKGSRVVLSSGEAVTTWKVHQLILYCFCGILAGIVGGLLGLGGGFILGPLFLELGIPPQVSSATAAFVMIFSSSMSVIQYYLLGRFPVPYALYFIAVAIVAALVGQHVVRRIISIVGGFGIADTIKKIEEGHHMGFDNICAYNV
ncbi:putative protein disulfide isomerase-like 1-6-like [Capsicum annuum]|nr:putative protein disulfide isomerase-like 1-6-like [Capsicum annuum]